MFELSVAFKYLIPKRKKLSVTLIATMSMGVISLIVWLVLVFLSVTEGMEKSWLKKLTDLNAPIKITPTEKYYSSYYYNIDSISSSSDYQNKTIGEKAISSLTDPYDEEEDREIPRHWPQKDLTEQGELKDFVKQTYNLLSHLKNEKKISEFQDFEMSGALMKLQLLRTSAPLLSFSEDSIHFISQVSYVASFPSLNPNFASLIVPPSTEDITHLIQLSRHSLIDHRNEESPSILAHSKEDFKALIEPIFQHTTLHTLRSPHPFWKVPLELFPESFKAEAYCLTKNGAIEQVILGAPVHKNRSSSAITGLLVREANKLSFISSSATIPLANKTSIFSKEIITFHSSCVTSLDTPVVEVNALLQGIPLKGKIPLQGLVLTEAKTRAEYLQTPSLCPPWVHSIKTSDNSVKNVLPSNSFSDFPVILPKGFKENGVLIGDRGYLSYSSSTASSVQEQRLSIFVAGFYDPGIMSVGNKCILAPKEVTSALNASSTSHAFDKIATNGVQVWLDDLSKTDEIKNEILKGLRELELEEYFEVSSYKDFDFAKELLQQFQSDKYLFSLIAIIIITVACCNIISLLVLLVNDKKKEIGILLSMGASSRSIASIFGVCGIVTGTIGCAIGCIAAYFTMHNIDTLVHLLSSMQGHDAFSAAFYGDSLPSTLSAGAVYFVMIATPILALVAGLIPAIKACLFKPATILRSE